MRTPVPWILGVAALLSALFFLIVPVRHGLRRTWTAAARDQVAFVRDAPFLDRVSPWGEDMLRRGNILYPAGHRWQLRPIWRRQFESGGARIGQRYEPVIRGVFVYKRMLVAIQGAIALVAGSWAWWLVRRERKRLGLEFPPEDRRWWRLWRLWMLGADVILAGAFFALGFATAGDLFTWFLPFLVGVALLLACAGGITVGWISAWRRSEIAAARPRLKNVGAAGLVALVLGSCGVLSWRLIFWIPAAGLLIGNEILILVATRARWAYLRRLNGTFE